MKKILMRTIFLAVTLSMLSTSPSFAEEKKTGDFVNGAKVWANTCNRCHNVRDPKEFSDSQWEMIMLHMRDRAGLTGEDTRDILKFLQNSN